MNPQIITSDPEMHRILGVLHQVARGSAPVLITGETGTGKELLARYLHRISPHCYGPFVAINCAAIPEGLVESELFGHEAGSFTGAVRQRNGKFEAAHNGTLLLDEIGDLAIGPQAKLLRVLQHQEFYRVGGTKAVRSDARIVATTNQDLPALISEKRFRADLFYRLNVIPLEVPPLRERMGDIPALVEHFIERAAARNRGRILKISSGATEKIMAWSWPGNVRELENVIERAVVLCEGGEIQAEHLMLGGETGGEPMRYFPGTSLRGMEKDLIIETLKMTEGNKTHAARELGISPRGLRLKMKRYGIFFNPSVAEG